MAVSNAESQLLQELTCPLCLELFSDPLILPCCHNACGKCLDAYIKHADPGGKVFNCPVCNETTINNAQIKSNHVLKNIAEGWRKWTGSAEDKNSVVCQICEKSSDRTISYYCDDCNITYCCACKNSFHPTKGVLASHAIVLVSETTDGASAQTTCSIHRKKYSYFCTDCRKLLCCNCKHRLMYKDHNCENISNVYIAELNLLQGKLQASRSSKSNMERTVGTIRSYQACLMGVKKRRVKLIKEYFSELRNCLDRKEEELIQKENAFDKLVAEQESSVREIQIYLSNINMMVSLVETTINRNNEMELLMMSPVISNEIGQLTTTSYGVPDASKSFNIPDVIDTTAVLNEISLLDADLGYVDRNEHTATFLLPNVSNLGSRKAFSEKWILKGHSWHMQAFRADDKLRFGLVFDANPTSKVPVTAECRLLQWDHSKKAYTKHFDETRIFTLDNSKWGKVAFIDWTDLFDTQESYVRDDKIRLQIHMIIKD